MLDQVLHDLLLDDPRAPDWTQKVHFEVLSVHQLLQHIRHRALKVLHKPEKLYVDFLKKIETAQMNRSPSPFHLLLTSPVVVPRADINARVGQQDLQELDLVVLHNMHQRRVSVVVLDVWIHPGVGE